MMHAATNATAAFMSWDLCWRRHIIPRVFAKRRLSGSFFIMLSLDADDRVILARIQSLLLLECHIYSHIHVCRQSGRDGDTFGFHMFPFCTIIPLEADWPKKYTTLSTEDSGMELCRTVRCA